MLSPLTFACSCSRNLLFLRGNKEFCGFTLVELVAQVAHSCGDGRCVLGRDLVVDGQLSRPLGSDVPLLQCWYEGAHDGYGLEVRVCEGCRLFVGFSHSWTDIFVLLPVRWEQGATLPFLSVRVDMHVTVARVCAITRS